MQTKKRNTRGFTLIELTVVLMILVALAGILVPTLSGYVERSHASASSTNIGEINKFVQLYQTKYLKGWGTGYDSLLTPANTFYPGLSSELSSGLLTINTLNTLQATSLSDGGITEIANMVATVPTGGSATFNANTELPVAEFTTIAPTTMSVCFLDDAQVRKAFGLSQSQVNSEAYVVFGLGQRNSLIGKVMADAPLHFDQADPKDVYSRFLVVFAIPESAATVGFKARFVGALGAEAGGLGEHLGTYYSKDAE